MRTISPGLKRARKRQQNCCNCRQKCERIGIEIRGRPRISLVRSAPIPNRSIICSCTCTPTTQLCNLRMGKKWRPTSFPGVKTEVKAVPTMADGNVPWENFVKFVRQLSPDLRNQLNAAELQSALIG